MFSSVFSPPFLFLPFPFQWNNCFFFLSLFFKYLVIHTDLCHWTEYLPVRCAATVMIIHSSVIFHFQCIDQWTGALEWVLWLIGCVKLKGNCTNVQWKRFMACLFLFLMATPLLCIRYCTSSSCYLCPASFALQLYMMQLSSSSCLIYHPITWSSCHRHPVSFVVQLYMIQLSPSSCFICHPVVHDPTVTFIIFVLLHLPSICTWSNCHHHHLCPASFAIQLYMIHVLPSSSLSCFICHPVVYDPSTIFIIFIPVHLPSGCTWFSCHRHCLHPPFHLSPSSFPPPIICRQVFLEEERSNADTVDSD